MSILSGHFNSGTVGILRELVHQLRKLMIPSISPFQRLMPSDHVQHVVDCSNPYRHVLSLDLCKQLRFLWFECAIGFQLIPSLVTTASADLLVD